MEAVIYDKKGKEAGKVKLPKTVFEVPFNTDLIHQVVVSMQGNKRTKTAHTKDRSEVRGGGIKPWRQKGTGRARHGSSRSPIWIGGGVTHGPRNEKDYSRKVNKKMKTKALFSILSRKHKDGEVIFVESLDFKAPKTADAKKVLDALGKNFRGLQKKYNAAHIALDQGDESIVKSFANFGNVTIDELRNMNPLDLMNKKYLIIENPKDSLKVLEGKTK
jgi:large subunit ribosomal protein L4